MIIVRHLPDVDAAACIAQGFPGVSGILDRVPRLFQQEPLLRVHEHGLARRNAEKARVEAFDILDEGPPATDGFLDGRQSRQVPIASAVLGNLGDRTDA